MSNRFLIILGVLILGFIGFLVYQNNDDGGSGDTGNTDVQASQHTTGEGTKNVTLVEYGDFQCPSCGQFFPIVEQVKEQYGDDITFQFRHFPLTQIHQNAMAAHRAAEAASKQGKFWEMHDLLYQRQNLWAQSQNAAGIMEDYATELELNVEQFKTDYQSSEVNAVINADLKAGQEIKVTGTPTFVINGEVVELPNPSLEAFTKLIDEAIANANQE
ncbi:thioredoxin domain-containing protein [Candidatus Saccharibacteria bacterium]|nr:thioredoxin domain-containing protein [Candidatus Saccharibacteria bacterium]